MAIDMISYLIGQQAGSGGSGDKGSNYKSITENQDGTYTVIDSDNVSHTISITEASDAITATLDGNTIPITLSTNGDIIKIGNSDINIAEQGESGGGNIGYQVTFKVDGNDYYIASCQQGESITEPPTPTMQGATFGAWQLNGVDVSFPYTPSADVELIARVEDITVTTAGTPLYTYSGGTVTKRLDGFAVYGYCTYNTTQKFLFLVSQTASNTEMSSNTMAGGGSVSFVYNGETWYYSHSNATVTTSVDHPVADVGDYFQYNSAALIAKAILDAYFGA